MGRLFSKRRGLKTGAARKSQASGADAPQAIALGEDGKHPVSLGLARCEWSGARAYRPMGVCGFAPAFSFALRAGQDRRALPYNPQAF